MEQTLNLFSEFDDELGQMEQSAPDQLWNASALDDLAIAAVARQIVPGLDYVRDFITRDEEVELVRHIDSMDWSNHWQRRTQYYGRRYLPNDEVNEHRAKARDRFLNSGIVDHLPWWAMRYRERLVEQGIFEHAPNQMGINEYLPGQGIAPHVDYHGGEVVSITLITGCVMDFTTFPVGGDAQKSARGTSTTGAALAAHEEEEGILVGPTEASMWLPPRSMVVLKGDARSKWTHGIARRKKDVVYGRVIPRGRRVSVTFRYID
jgi:alkylated DNA repair dioxygenase AlkB